MRTAWQFSADVVHAENIRAGEHRRHRGGETAFEALVRLPDQNLADESLARNTDQKRLAEGGKARQAAQQLQIVLEVFAEADARIDDDRLGATPASMAS